MITKITPANSFFNKPNPLAPSADSSATTVNIPSIEAVVVDVVTNESHVYYSPDGYNVGSVKVRKLVGDTYREDSQLEWAFPIDATIEEWPLMNETVQLVQIFNRLYYIRKINVGNMVNNQALFGLEQDFKRLPSARETNKALNTSKFIPTNISSRKDILGEYFSKKNTFRLKHFEGDTIIQGRSGNSIRFGNAFTRTSRNTTPFKSKTTNQSPTMLISVGHANRTPTPNTEYGRITEDFNNDASSIWLVQDMEILLASSTRRARSFRRATDIPESLNSNSIGVNSGTIYINSKRDGIYITSNKDIGISSNTGIGCETDGELQTYSVRPTTISSRNRISLIGSRVFVGSTNNNAQPIVLGAELNQLLITLLQGIIMSAPTHVITAMGPGALNPQLVATLQQLLVILRRRDILSDDNFVTKTNEVVE